MATDDELFRQTVGPVKPVSGADRARDQRKPKPRPRQRDADELSVRGELLDHPVDLSRIESGEELLFRRSGVRDKTFRRLRRGQFSIEDELDLHGMSVASAASEIDCFLQHAQHLGLRIVRIVHGKGYRSAQGKPVLKNLVDHQLRRRKQVLAFASTPGPLGGSGAVLVILANPNKDRS